jgi:hypothetical protein
MCATPGSWNGAVILRRDSATGALKNCYRFVNPNEKNPVYPIYRARVFELFPEFQNPVSIRWIKFEPRAGYGPGIVEGIRKNDS